MTYKDIRRILEAATGIKRESPILVSEAKYTYPIKESPWDNWFAFAYLAFKKLESERIR